MGSGSDTFFTPRSFCGCCRISCHKIVLPFRYFRFPHPQSDLLEKCNQLGVAHVFVDSVFIIVVMGCLDKVILHHIARKP